MLIYKLYIWINVAYKPQNIIKLYFFIYILYIKIREHQYFTT